MSWLVIVTWNQVSAREILGVNEVKLNAKYFIKI